MELISKVSHLWGSSTKIKQTHAIHIISKIHAILTNIHEENISIPKLVVVGTQSSGKTSLLNGIMNIDLLPTGSQMTTRAPLHLELYKMSSINHARIECGNYSKNNDWNPQLTISVSQNISISERAAVRDYITKTTNNHTGNTMSITNKKIILKIYHPDVPHMHMIDLPGMTLVACTDKGQPKDIKEQINSLIHSYIDDSNTIIIAVLAARPDIETDMALELIKQYDKNLTRTIGILTKVDLMNESTNIKEYIESNVSVDLQMDYGYYAVRNRTQKESQTMTLENGYKMEHNFFKSHLIYNEMLSTRFFHRFGVQSVREALYSTLVSKINENLSSIKQRVETALLQTQERIGEIGESIPKEAQSIYIQRSVTDISGKLQQALDQNCETSVSIKTCFIDFRQKIDTIFPGDDFFSDQIIRRTRRECEGNHMTFPTPKVEVLERCLTQRNPFQLFLEPANECCSKICDEVLALFEHIVCHSKYAHYKSYQKRVMSTFLEQIISPLKRTTYKKIYQMIGMQESYIWTDDKDFQGMLLHHDENFEPVEHIRKLCMCYFKSVANVLKDCIPKIVMHFIITPLKQQCANKLFEQLNIMENLFEETPKIIEIRNELKEKRKGLQTVQKLLQNI